MSFGVLNVVPSKKDVLSSLDRFSSKGPGGRTAPASCRKPAGSPQEIGVSAKTEEKKDK